jgi:hypothetical protein
MGATAIVLMLFLTLPGRAREQHSPTAMQCEQRILAAERSRDIHVFEELLSERLVAIGPDGKRYTKDSMLRILKSIPAQQVTASDFLEIPIDHNAVVVNYVVTQKLPAGTRQHTATSIWLLKGQNCSMIFHQGTVIVPE